MNSEVETYIQEAVERANRRNDEKNAEMQVSLDAIMLRLTQRNKPVSDAEVEKWEWEKCVVRDMQAHGWDSRHIKRIAPNWNCPPQERAFEVMCGKLQGNGAIVALVGGRGIGKTTNAAEQSRLRVEARRAYFKLAPSERATPHPPPEPGRYEKLGRLAGMFKPLYADFGSVNSEDLARQLETWCRAELVVLDELHESDDLKTNMRFLVDFVDRRYANKRDTILISNHTAEEFQTHVNSSIISRLGHHGGIIRCNWESHRK